MQLLLECNADPNLPGFILPVKQIVKKIISNWRRKFKKNNEWKKFFHRLQRFHASIGRLWKWRWKNLVLSFGICKSIFINLFFYFANFCAFVQNCIINFPGFLFFPSDFILKLKILPWRECKFPYSPYLVKGLPRQWFYYFFFESELGFLRHH